MPYTLADLDAIYRDPQQEAQAQARALAQAQAQAAAQAAAQAQAQQAQTHSSLMLPTPFESPLLTPPQPELQPLVSLEDSRELEHDLNALQETLDKDMMEMEQSSSGIMPPQVMEEESLELQEIMVDNVVVSEVTLEDDVFDREEILDGDPQDTLKDDFD